MLIFHGKQGNFGFPQLDYVYSIPCPPLLTQANSVEIETINSGTFLWQAGTNLISCAQLQIFVLESCLGVFKHCLVLRGAAFYYNFLCAPRWVWVGSSLPLSMF